jgi:hypothetical protein
VFQSPPRARRVQIQHTDAKTNSPFVFQRRYSVALLALAAAATSPTVNLSKPCSCRSFKVTANISISREDHSAEFGCELHARLI